MYYISSFTKLFTKIIKLNHQAEAGQPSQLLFDFFPDLAPDFDILLLVPESFLLLDLAPDFLPDFFPDLLALFLLDLPALFLPTTFLTLERFFTEDFTGLLSSTCSFELLWGLDLDLDFLREPGVFERDFLEDGFVDFYLGVLVLFLLFLLGVAFLLLRFDGRALFFMMTFAAAMVMSIVPVRLDSDLCLERVIGPWTFIIFLGVTNLFAFR